jgi:hypothetical protein
VLSAFRAFVLGAFSKSVATILTYPAIRYYYTSLLKLESLSLVKSEAIGLTWKWWWP